VVLESLMTPQQFSKLKDLRARLAGVQPYPWVNMETWIAAASPYFRTVLPQYRGDFDEITDTPSWSAHVRVVSGEACGIRIHATTTSMKPTRPRRRKTLRSLSQRKPGSYPGSIVSLISIALMISRHPMIPQSAARKQRLRAASSSSTVTIRLHEKQ
jgi:hypothetical protein